MVNILQKIKNELYFVSQNNSENIWERRVADFYLNILGPYDDRVLKHHRGFGVGVGGSGDNIIVMPVIERDEKGIVLEGECLKKQYCVFDDFYSYLMFIQEKKCVKKDTQHWKRLPVCVNGILRDDYTSIWLRSQGLERN